MIIRTVAAAAALTLISTGALAFHCPKDVAAIDHALTKAKLSSSQKATVQRLRNQGLALHKSGKHRQSEATLAEAMRIILGSL